MTDDYGDIIRHIMRDLQEDDADPSEAPPCEGCGQRVKLAPFQLRASNVGVEMVMFCAERRELATIEDADDRDIER
jgi:hypothetical protein